MRGEGYQNGAVNHSRRKVHMRHENAGGVYPVCHRDMRRSGSPPSYTETWTQVTCKACIKMKPSEGPFLTPAEIIGGPSQTLLDEVMQRDAALTRVKRVLRANGNNRKARAERAELEARRDRLEVVRLYGRE